MDVGRTLVVVAEMKGGDDQIGDVRFVVDGIQVRPDRRQGDVVALTILRLIVVDDSLRRYDGGLDDHRRPRLRRRPYVSGGHRGARTPACGNRAKQRRPKSDAYRWPHRSRTSV